jgi:hypothetical protein
MAKWIKRPKRVDEVTYVREYRWADCPDAGFAFPCAIDGTVKLEEMLPAGRENLQFCRQMVKGGRIRALGVQKRTHSYVEPGIIECRCGQHVTLEHHDYSACSKCGQHFNLFGQELKPPQQWFGEDGRTADTGETMADVFGPAK